MLELEFPPDVDVQVVKDAAGRTKVTLTPRFYTTRGQVALCYLTTCFKSPIKPDDKYMLRIAGATGQIHFRSAAKAVLPAFLSAAAADDAPTEKDKK